MNERAELGLETPVFKIPTASTRPGITRPYDLAILTDTAMNYPLFAQIVATRNT